MTTSERRSSGAGRCHPAGAQAGGARSSCFAAASSSSAARLARARARVLGPPGLQVQSRRRSSGSASRSSPSFVALVGAVARPAAAPAGHRHAGGALRRRARAVAAGRDPERRGRRRGGAEPRRRAPRHPRTHGRAGGREVPDDSRRPRGRPEGHAPSHRRARHARGRRALLLVVGPEFLRQGASALLVLSRSAEAASPYAIKVTPGDVTVPKGSDQTVIAQPRRVPVERRRADGACRAATEVRAGAAGRRRRARRRSKACCST